MKIQFGHINKLISLSVLIEAEQAVYSGVLVKYKKQEIEIIEQFRNLKGFDKLIGKIGKGRPVLLHFDGKGVLNKENELTPNFRQDVTVNSNVNDFYFTNYTQDQKVYTSVVRKTAVQHIMNQFTAVNIPVIGISSGPFILIPINRYLNEEILVSSLYRLAISNNELVSFSKRQAQDGKVYRIGNDSVDEKSITALAHTALFFNPNAQIELPENDENIKRNIEESEQKVLFKQFGFGLMTFFLVVLFANFMYLKYLNEKHQENVIKLAEHTETFNEISKLEEEKTRKETLLRTSGVLTKKFISFYMAMISNSVPKQVSFTEFTVKPTKEEIKEKYKIEVDNQQITIKGTAKSSQYLSDWLGELKTFEWIRKVEIEEYDYQKGYGVFYLKIII